MERKGVELLASKACVQLIAISEWTRGLQAAYLDNFPEFKEAILKKTTVLHPPQRCLIGSIDHKPTDQAVVNILLVGNQICSKGGREAVSAVIKLFREGAPVKLTIVSGMEPDSYASQTTYEDISKLKQLIASNGECINWMGRQSNEYVVKELLKSDLALLPTYAETYGYFILEAQAAGCPVVTTNITALSEINNDGCGWIISVPKDKKGNALLATPQDRRCLSELLENELYRIISKVCESRQSIVNKSKAALQRVRQYHDPNRYIAQLESIYRHAISSTLALCSVCNYML